MSNSASHPAGLHCWGREGSTQFAQQLGSAVTAPPLVGCVVWSSKKSPSSTYLLPMPFALNCRMVKGSPSEALVVVGDGSGLVPAWALDNNLMGYTAAP